MKRIVLMIFCLIGLSSIAGEFNSQKEINDVVNAWATKWNITCNVEERFEKLTGANPSDVKTFKVKFNAYVQAWRADKSVRMDVKSSKSENRSVSTKKAVKSTQKAGVESFRFHNASQYVLELVYSVDLYDRTITLEHDGVVEVIDSKYIHENSNLVALMLVDGKRYVLNIEDDDPIVFMIKNGQFYNLEHSPPNDQMGEIKWLDH